MQTKLRLGSAFGTKLYVDISWLFVIAFGIFTLVYTQIEPIPEALVTTMLIFGSVLMAALLQVREAHNQELGWERITLVPLGNIAERTYKSTKGQEARIASIALLVHGVLAILFGGLGFLISDGFALGTELHLVGLFNLGLVGFHLLFRLTPQADNLLNAWLSYVWHNPYPSRFLRLIQEIMIWVYVASGIIILLAQFDRFALGWWFFSLLIMSRIVTLGEEHGEYREEIPSSIWSSIPEYNMSTSNTHAQFE